MGPFRLVILCQMLPYSASFLAATYFNIFQLTWNYCHGGQGSTWSWTLNWNWLSRSTSAPWVLTTEWNMMEASETNYKKNDSNSIPWQHFIQRRKYFQYLHLNNYAYFLLSLNFCTLNFIALWEWDENGLMQKKKNFLILKWR